MASIIIFDNVSERQNSSLIRSSQKLSLDLRRAENFSLSSKIFKTYGVPCGWGVHFNGLDSTSYIIFADLALNANCSDRDFVRAANGSEDFETVNLGYYVNVSYLSGGLSDIVFSPPDPKVVFVPDQTTASVVLINKNLLTRTININKFGFISSP